METILPTTPLEAKIKTFPKPPKYPNNTAAISKQMKNIVKNTSIFFAFLFIIVIITNNTLLCNYLLTTNKKTA
jgi:hypothetical protein